MAKATTKLKLALCIALGCAALVGLYLSSSRDCSKSPNLAAPNRITDTFRSDASRPPSWVETKPFDPHVSQKETEPTNVSVSDKASSYIDLPELYTDKAIKMMLLKASAMKTWRTQDYTMGTWPEYADIEDELSNELSRSIDLAHTPNQELITTALDLRKQFWQAGGGLSQDSYQHIYKARLLLELAYSRNPEDLRVTDELAQTMMSADLRRKHEKDGNRMVSNEELDRTILEIRSSQFTTLKKEIDHGRPPVIEDFIRLYDLAVLQSRYEKESVKHTVEWLQREASRGGWTGYNAILARFYDSVSKGEEFDCNIYTATAPSIPDDFRYSRRLPSFKWPVAEERGRILWGHDGTKIPFKMVFVEQDQLFE